MVFNIRLRDQFDPENVYPKMCIRILQHFYVNIAFFRELRDNSCILMSKGYL